MIRMMAMVSSIACLLGGAECAIQPLLGRKSNVCATAEPGSAASKLRRLVPCCLAVALAYPPAAAEARQESTDPGVNRIAAAGRFVAGAAAGLAAHEGGHLLLNLVFDA